MDKTIRLDKYLAHRGAASRRNIKKFLKEEYITVNGKRITESGTRINPEKDEILLNGITIKSPKPVYYIINKPKGIVSTTADEYGRKNVLSLIPTNLRIYPVGRLDKDTTGLLLLTNDGEITYKLTHPKFHINKIYHLMVSGKPNTAQLTAFRKGVLLEDGITSPAEVNVLKITNSRSLLEVTIHEGWNRQIRRMCETVDLELLELKRIKFGPITLGDLKEGKYRKLNQQEIHELKNVFSEK